jgi:hypothetical protein
MFTNKFADIKKWLGPSNDEIEVTNINLSAIRGFKHERIVCSRVCRNVAKSRRQLTLHEIEFLTDC